MAYRRKYERERLIELLQGWGNKENDGVRAESISDYLLENGIIVPPVNVGQKVYGPFEYRGKPFISEEIDTLEFNGTHIYATIRGRRYLWINRCLYHEQSGDILFLTKEEAEKALKGGATNEAN